MTAQATGELDYARLYRAVSEFDDAGEEFERIVRRVYECALRDGDTAVDVGAHVGKHAVPMALACGPSGHVLAVEPIDWAVERLDARILGARLGAVVTTFYGCCGEAEGEVEFSVVPSHPGWSSIAPRAEVTDSVRMTVPQFTVDRLCRDAERVRFLKIDVEGAEPLVLRGAVATIDRFRPVIHVEVIEPALEAFGLKLEDVGDPLRSRGYRIYDLLGNDVTDVESWLRSSAAPAPADYIAVLPDDRDHDRILEVLRSSFLAERLDRVHAPEDLPLPPMHDRRAGPGGSAPARQARPRRAASGSPAAADWPGHPSAVHEGIVLLVDGPRVYEHATGGFRPLSTRTPVRLPLLAHDCELANGRLLKVQLHLPGIRGGRNVTLTEVFWTASRTVTLCRVNRSGTLEILQLADDRVVTSTSAPLPVVPQSYTVEIARLGPWVTTVARADDVVVRTHVPAAKVGLGSYDLCIGARMHPPHKAESAGPDATLTIQSRPLPLALRAGLAYRGARSGMRRLRNSAQVPRALRHRLRKPAPRRDVR